MISYFRWIKMLLPTNRFRTQQRRTALLSVISATWPSSVLRTWSGTVACTQERNRMSANSAARASLAKTSSSNTCYGTGLRAPPFFKIKLPPNSKYLQPLRRILFGRWETLPLGRQQTRLRQAVGLSRKLQQSDSYDQCRIWGSAPFSRVLGNDWCVTRAVQRLTKTLKERTVNWYYFLINVNRIKLSSPLSVNFKMYASAIIFIFCCMKLLSMRNWFLFFIVLCLLDQR